MDRRNCLGASEESREKISAGKKGRGGITPPRNDSHPSKLPIQNSK